MFFACFNWDDPLVFKKKNFEGLQDVLVGMTSVTPRFERSMHVFMLCLFRYQLKRPRTQKVEFF